MSSLVTGAGPQTRRISEFSFFIPDIRLIPHIAAHVHRKRFCGPMCAHSCLFAITVFKFKIVVCVCDLVPTSKCRVHALKKKSGTKVTKSSSTIDSVSYKYRRMPLHSQLSKVLRPDEDGRTEVEGVVPSVRCPSSCGSRTQNSVQSLTGYTDINMEDMKQKGWYAPISPASPFAQCWELSSGILLLYSIFVTPLLIAFYTIDAGFCGPAPTG